MKELFVINIGRQLGSGGKDIGEIIARRLGVRLYDKELLTLAAKRAEVREELLADKDEKAANPWLFKGFYEGGPKVKQGQSAEDVLYDMQSEIILELAEKGDCIIVGRCADHVLESKHVDCLTICPHGTDTDVRCDARASVDQGGRCCNELDRRDLKGLSKGDGGQLHKSHIFLLVHDRCSLSRKIYTCLPHQSEFFKIFIKILCSKPHPYFNKNRITGILHPLYKRLGSMSSRPRTPDPAVFHKLVSRAVNTLKIDPGS